MGAEFFIALRYLIGRKGTKFISFISFISIIGIALGVTSLIVVLSVMGGFGNELKKKIIGTYPHLSMELPDGISDYINVMKKIEKEDSVVAASPYITGEGIIRYRNYTSGVIIRGIHPEREAKITNIDEYLIRGELPKNKFEIMVGKVLAEQLDLRLQENVKLVTPIHTKPADFKLVGIFESGMYDYDVNLVFIDLLSAQDIFETQGLVNGIGIRVEDPYIADRVKRNLILNSDLPYPILSWQDRNKNLFSALKLEKTTMFIILTLIVIVACFSIMGTLIMVVMEKTKDIGILKSIGASNKSIRKIFTYQGLIFGISGAISGGAIGLSICYLLSEYKFIKLPKDIYYIDTLPVQIQWLDVGIITVCAILLSIIASIYPATCAAKLNPAEAIRYE